MRRVRKLKQKYEPPEGMMLFLRRLRSIASVEAETKNIMNWHDEMGHGSDRHWSKDPSYNWAEEVEAKRGKK